jgi:L-asparaginase II
MTNPVLVEVTRGPLVESRHRGAIAVVDAKGACRVAIGDVGQPVFPRSAVKLIQALPLVESGAADAHGFGPAELALACASHSGEPRHTALAASMLARAGRSVADLECGTHMPAYEPASADLIRAGETPTALHNNCSGKHAGFVCLACHRGVDVKGYVGEAHPVMREVTAALRDTTGAPLGADVCAIDGCSIPTYGIPLNDMARAFARLSTGEGLSPDRARAAKRLMDACMAESFYVAGTARYCTDLMTAFGGTLFIKGGAEGVYCGAFPELGLGVALKCDDGAQRGSEAMMAAVIAGLMSPSGSAQDALMRRLIAPVETRRRVKAGEIRPVAGLVESIREGRTFV